MTLVYNFRLYLFVELLMELCSNLSRLDKRLHISIFIKRGCCQEFLHNTCKLFSFLFEKCRKGISYYSTLILIWLVNRMSIELFKFKKCSLQLEPHTIFVAREADGGANHSTGILEPNEVKVIMCHAGRSYSR